MSWRLLSLIAPYLFIAVIAEEEFLSRLCRTQTTSCADCVELHPKCAWCYDLDFSFDRCNIASELFKNRCSSLYEGEKSSTYTEINKEFEDVTDETIMDAVQIRPQKVKVKLRPGATETIKLKYKLAKDYPLDIYYLMDASFSMKDDIETVATLGDHLTQSVSNLTKYFRNGFGTYSDKVVMPFSKMESLANPCKDTAEKFCSPSYGFKHEYSLNRNVTEFMQKVNNTKITANLDNAEGAMDAIMQILVCSEHIGWRNQSRKLILLLTNGLLHFAGDGKLGGIIHINDGVCHLDKEGFYNKSELYDYPSLEQIYRKLKKQKTNVIFAITEDMYKYYKKLNDLIPNFSYVTELHSDSSNILSVIKKGYEEVVSIVEFQDNSTDPLKIEYFSHCNKDRRGFSTYLNRTSVCYEVKEGEEYEFNVKINLEKCPEDPKLWQQKVVIDETHLENENLVIDIEMLCGCQCTENKKNSPKCNYHGDIECGICKCYSGWSGQYCNCDLSNFENSQNLRDSCREITENSTSIMCHGNGECVCGKCECDNQWTGKYCECSNCNKINGKECGGPSQGLCSCGTCLCMPGFTGPDCQCSLDKSTCFAPGDSEECSGQGTCICGQCECNTKPSLFSGTYCEKCSTCSGLCHLYDDCAKCNIIDTCTKECSTVNAIEFVDYLEDDTETCLVVISSDYCPQRKYVYNITHNNTVNLIIQKTSCNILTSAYGNLITGIIIFLGIVVLGIVIIIAVQKYIAVKDAKEFAQFNEQQKNSTFTSNPLHRSAVTQYQVPEEFQQMCE